DAGSDLCVEADDGKVGSLVAEFSCFAIGEAVGWTDHSRAVFRIETFSSGARPVDVEIYAVDLAIELSENAASILTEKRRKCLLQEYRII
ncbi:hypothetical protein, partial [Merdimonas faecis]